MAEWFKKLTEVVLGNFYGSPKPVKKQSSNVNIEFPKTKDEKPYPGTAMEKTGSNRKPNTTSSGQNLEDLSFKHFSGLNNTDGSVTNALNNYSKEVF